MEGPSLMRHLTTLVSHITTLPVALGIGTYQFNCPYLSLLVLSPTEPAEQKPV